MALADDITAAIDKRMRTSPTSLTSKVYGPVITPPEKVELYQETQRLKREILELARELDEILNRF
jgi:hypothetical protein